MPTSWRRLTTEQLEDIARMMQHYTHREQPIDMLAVKSQLLLKWNHLRILDVLNPLATEPQDRRLLMTHPDVPVPFEWTVWELHYWIDQNMAWMDKPIDIAVFPYPEMRRGWKRIAFRGPDIYMQNFSWRQYQLAGDYLEYYVASQNRLVQLAKTHAASRTDMKVAMHNVNNAKALFMATIMNRSIAYIDVETGTKVRDFAYQGRQTDQNARYFDGFPDDKFQVVLWWWSGMMTYLKHHYPKCFKEQDTKAKTPVDPLQLRSRITTTLEKYLQTNSEVLNREVYINPLRHINDMVTQNEEMERIRQK